MPSLFKRANDMRKLCGAGFTVAEAHALLSDFYAGKDTLRIPPHLVKVAERFINDLPLDGSTKIEKQRRSLPSKLKEMKKLYSYGFSATGARDFVSQIRDEKNDTLNLSLNDVPNDTKFSKELIGLLNQELHISRLNIEKGLLPKELFLLDFMKNLNATFVSSLTLKDIPAFQYEGVNLQNVKELKIIEGSKPYASLPEYTFLKTADYISKLSLAPERLYKEDLTVLKNGLPPRLKDFSLYVGKARSVQTAEIVEALPEGLDSLTLDNLKFKNSDDVLKLHKPVRSLKSLAFHNCRFEEPDMQARLITRLLKDTPVEHLTVSGKETGLTDAQVNTMLEAFEQPSSMIVKLDFPDIELSDATKERINKLEETRQRMTGKASYNHSETKPEKSNEETAASRSPEEERKFTLFKEASANGDINKIYDALAKENKTLETSDYQLTDGNGNRLIDALAYSKQLNKVFAPQHWKNAKDMQTVYDLLPDIHKAQLDGKDGRPNFKVLKNQVMANAVRRNVTVNKSFER